MEQTWDSPEALARRYAGDVFRLAYARTGSRADAEDVMQETFIRLLRARPDFAEPEQARAWLLPVAAKDNYEHFFTSTLNTHSFLAFSASQPLQTRL